LLEQSFTACMALLTTTSKLWWGRRSQASPQWCYLHRLRTVLCNYYKYTHPISSNWQSFLQLLVNCGTNGAGCYQLMPFLLTVSNGWRKVRSTSNQRPQPSSGPQPFSIHQLNPRGSTAHPLCRPSDVSTVTTANQSLALPQGSKLEQSWAEHSSPPKISGSLLVGWLVFNVPFQHNYGYITDERSGMESYPLTQW